MTVLTNKLILNFILSLYEFLNLTSYIGKTNQMEIFLIHQSVHKVLTSKLTVSLDSMSNILHLITLHEFPSISEIHVMLPNDFSQ